MQFGPKSVIGSFGELHPAVLETLDVDGPIVAFEILLDALPSPKAKPTKTKAKLDLAELMPVERDFAFVVERTVAAADILKAAQAADRTLITGLSVFDLYEGPGVPDGKKSVAIAATLQPHDRSLTEADLDALTQRVVAEVGKRTGAVLRG